VTGMKKICMALILCIILSVSAPVFADNNTMAIEGFFAAVEGETILIERYDGRISRFSIAGNAEITIDSIPVRIEQFRPGLEVYGEINANNQVVRLEAYSTEVLGYIPEGGIIKKGIVKNFSESALTIQSDDNSIVTYTISPATVVLKKNMSVPLSSLYPGDYVKLYMYELNSLMVMRVEVQDDSIKVKDVYKAVLSGVDMLSNTLMLNNVEVFVNGNWQRKNNLVSIPFSEEMPVYIGGTKIPVSHLKYYKGRTIYMAVKAFFGKDKVEKIVIKQYYESLLTDTIKAVNKFSSSLELKNGRDIIFNEGTIIVQNGRLMDKDSIERYLDVCIAGDGKSGQLTADMIYVYNRSINHNDLSDYRLYFGEIDEIYKDRLVLDDVDEIEDNEWDSTSDKTFYYDNDIYIYDIDKSEIYNNAEILYSYFRNESDDDFDYYEYAYVYADGNRICAIALTSDYHNTNYDRVTVGTVEEVEDHAMVGWRVKLKNAADWSDRKEAWMPRSSELAVILENAMIVKDGKIISPQDVKPGDDLYMVRDTRYVYKEDRTVAKVVIVK